MNKTYLGDGLYAEFDGYQFKLMANDQENPTDTVYLDLNVYKSFVRFVDQCLMSDGDSEMKGD